MRWWIKTAEQSHFIEIRAPREVDVHAMLYLQSPRYRPCRSSRGRPSFQTMAFLVGERAF